MRPLQSVRSNSKPADWLDALATLLFVIAAVGTGAGFADDKFWLGEIAVHFRVQWAAALLIAAVAMLVRRRRLAMVVALGLCAVNAAVVVPDLLPDARRVRAGGERLSILAINVMVENRNHVAVARLIEERNADLVALSEINQKWIDDLAPVLARYPAHIEMPFDDALGIGLWSRRPMQDAHVRYFGGGSLPSAVATVRFRNEDVTIIVLHLWPPKNPDMVDLRDHQIADIAFSRSMFANEMVLVGDLNLTPWSSTFKFLEDALGVRDTRQGFGLQTTWPADRGVFAIPIDHCLTTPGLMAARREVGPKIGSDHFPLFVDLAFAE